MTETPMAGQPTKTCNTCGRVKPLAEYSKRHDSIDGRSHKCKGCDSARQRSEPGRQVNAKARQQAVRRLREKYPAEFARLYREELARLTGSADATTPLYQRAAPVLDLTGMLLLEAHWGGESITAPGLLIAAPAGTRFEAITGLLLDGLGWDNRSQHLWHFQIPEDRLTSKGTFWPNRGARISGRFFSYPSDFHPGHPDFWYADTEPVETWLKHRDQCYWAFDYGDNHVLRVQAFDGDGQADGHGVDLHEIPSPATTSPHCWRGLRCW